METRQPCAEEQDESRNAKTWLKWKNARKPTLQDLKCMLKQLKEDLVIKKWKSGMDDKLENTPKCREEEDKDTQIWRVRVEDRSSTHEAFQSRAGNWSSNQGNHDWTSLCQTRMWVNIKRAPWEPAQSYEERFLLRPTLAKYLNFKDKTSPGD